MITAIFRDNTSLWVGLSLALILLVPAAVLWAHRIRRPRIVAGLFAAGIAVELAATLHPEGGYPKAPAPVSSIPTWAWPSHRSSG
ncbi:hypothetical protein [Streptomyces sp. SID3343]|uniref:hypothetical protein n=1 Tax=Streptomyces sp. SID3343 TaxID=2690260 RepID=UPI0013713E89|nr:hypothetical protein [Streptomyces sp. SID3343]MYV99924.1 hypothetical protein [Streptomyces sp. SID3343]